MRQAFDENSKKFGMEKLSFEAVERLIYENRNSAQQAIKAQQEKAMQKAERREEEVRRFKEDQKQIMIEKERQAREKQEKEAVVNDEQGRPAVQAQGIDEKYYKKVENFTGEQAWRDWSFQFKATTRIVNEAAYHLIETAENEEKEINDALSLSEEQRSLSSGIFNILGTLGQRRTSPDITHKRIQRIRSMEKAFQEIQRERCGETTRNEHERNEDSIWEISWQRLRDNLSRRSQLLSMGTGR